MLTAILAFIAQIPGLANLASSWMTARYNAQVAITTAQIGGDTEKAKAIIAGRVQGLSVIAGSTLLTILVVGFAVPIVIYFWKIIIFDVVVGSLFGCSGSHQAIDCAIFNTDPVKGQVGDYMATVIWSLFGSATAAGAISVGGNMIRGK